MQNTGLMLSVPTLQEATGYGDGKLRSLGPCACQANALHPQDDKVPAPALFLTELSLEAAEEEKSRTSLIPPEERW